MKWVVVTLIVLFLLLLLLRFLRSLTLGQATIHIAYMKEVVVVPHQAVGKDLQAPPGMHLAEALQEGGAIRRGLKDGPRGQSPVHHVVGGAGEFNAEWARHDGRVVW